ncbi:SOS response-associated peptidase [Bacillus sp. T33-2]|uniref:SOS response-associated peptidase n=1 Tax=Bacillus sp. T33-2 TaxID=2054168 RepID=UPI000C786AD4|nr:SOS response-associated peptidase [Bacillus sp. T33-2]PLR98802.1 hypothetical protein CVD19_03975 [Bacillus sp. T33-2]
MCGRFSLYETVDSLQVEFGFDFDGELEPRYNIAPGQNILAVLGGDARRRGMMLRWGLIPFWATDENIGYRLINARAETLDEKASFKKPLKSSRCLIPADGFYEWKKEESSKRPFRFAMKNEKPFAFAGLWETWNKNGNTIHSCTIITTTANDVTRKVHERMPVILPAEEQEIWLDHSIQDADYLKSLLKPYDAEEMKCFEVSPRINSARNEGRELILPLNSL